MAGSVAGFVAPHSIGNGKDTHRRAHRAIDGHNRDGQQTVLVQRTFLPHISGSPDDQVHAGGSANLLQGSFQCSAQATRIPKSLL